MSDAKKRSMVANYRGVAFAQDLMRSGDHAGKPHKKRLSKKVGEHQRSRYDTKSTYDTVATPAILRTFTVILFATHATHTPLQAWIDIIVTTRLNASMCICFSSLMHSFCFLKVCPSHSATVPNSLTPRLGRTERPLGKSR